jgi:hypothetical protein
MQTGGAPGATDNSSTSSPQYLRNHLPKPRFQIAPSSLSVRCAHCSTAVYRSVMTIDSCPSSICTATVDACGESVPQRVHRPGSAAAAELPAYSFSPTNAKSTFPSGRSLRRMVLKQSSVRTIPCFAISYTRTKRPSSLMPRVKTNGVADAYEV